MTDVQLHVRVLLDTGPTPRESEEIRKIFHDLGMTADIEGHSYGGPPPTSAFLIVVNTDLVPLIDAFFVQGPSGSDAFQKWAGQLLALRSDAGVWGRQHTLKLEDAWCRLGVTLPHDLPVAAYDTILSIDLTRFDRDSPPTTIEWNPLLHRWQARPHEEPRHLARRVAVRPGPGTGAPRVCEIPEADLHRIWQLTEDPSAHTLTWQRAKMVLLSRLGWSPGAIADKMLVKRHLVGAVIQDFNADGLASLDPAYPSDRRGALSEEEEREAYRIATGHPGDYGVPLSSWDAVTLSDFLVSQGVVDDITPAELSALCPDASIETGPARHRKRDQGTRTDSR